MTDFYSRNDTNYSGDVYSIPFDYIDEQEVQVYIDNELWTQWHFTSKNQLTLDEVPEEISSKSIISIRRNTDITDKVVTYNNNSLLNMENLNKSQDQLLYAVQEIYDNNTQFAIDIRAEVDEKVETVSDAVEKLEFLEDSVEIANEAALEATEQAQIATEKAEETLNTYNEAMTEIATLRQDSINEVNQLVADHTNDLNALDQLIKKDADAIINRVGLNMFDTVLKDHVLSYEESKGLALQGTYVYKKAVAGSRYGYPDFYNKVIEEYNETTTTEVVNGVTVKVNSNGHKFYDIAYKQDIDTYFNTTGFAWFYGVDEENERIFLPRNNYFEQVTGNTSDVNKSIKAGLPNIWGRVGNLGCYNSTIAEGVFKTTRDGNQIIPASGTTSWTATFDASTYNSIYGNSDTVQPNSVKKLLYIVVGNQVADTSWIDVVTQVEAGVKDIEDKKNICINEIEEVGNSYDNLTHRDITNCLLEVPQNIKLELNNGTLILKAGSIVTVPNGFEADGTTPKFDYVTVESNLSNTSTGNTQMMVFRYPNGDITTWGTILFYSGGTVPTGSTYMCWYDTTNNIIKYTMNGGSSWTSGVSFPIGLVTANTTQIISIDQVFNGFGYIGSEAWADKGIKYLISNGRNEDRTAKNLEVTTSKLTLIHTDAYTNNNLALTLDENGELGFYSYFFEQEENPAVAYSAWYKPSENLTYSSWHTTEFIAKPLASCGLIDRSVGQFYNLRIKQPFRAVDYSDFANTPHITKIYQNGASWYRVWSDGWIEQGGQTGAFSGINPKTITYLKQFSNTNYNLQFSNVSTRIAASYPGYLFIRSFTNTSFTCYNEGGPNAFWYACGY